MTAEGIIAAIMAFAQQEGAEEALDLLAGCYNAIADEADELPEHVKRALEMAGRDIPVKTKPH